MVSGTDEHGTPILVAGRTGRASTPRETGRPLQPGHRRGPAAARPVVRPVHPHHHDQPLRGGAGDVPRPARQRLRLPADHAGRDLARPPAGRCPTATSRAPARSAGTTERPRRPVRQLRQPAGPDRPDQPALAGSTARRRSSSRPSTTSSTCRPSPTSLGWLPAVQDALAAQRAEVLAEPARRPQATGDHPRPGLGHPGAAGGLARRGDKRLYVWFDAVIGYLSASIEWAARIRRPGGLAGLVAAGERARPTTSWARTTSSSTPRSGRRCCSATPARRAPSGGKPGALGALNRPYEVVSCEFLTMEGKKFSSSRSVVIYVARHAVPLRRRRAALLPASRRPGEPGHRLHLGGVPSGATTTSWWPAGATWSTGRSRWPPRTSARSRPPAS